MKRYERPIALVNGELAEGVYASSGDCYTVSANMHQKPQTGRGDYRTQINAVHQTTHHSGHQQIAVCFNMPVVYKSCSNATGVTGSGSNKIVLDFAYHNNPGPEYIGLGELVVEADQGLAITDIKCTYCNEDCGQH